MNNRNKIVNRALFFIAFCFTLLSCQKMDRPALGDYPKDTNPPGGPLKFYAAMDGASVDSIRANFGIDKDVTYVEGASGKAMQAGLTGYVVYPSANDFSASKSFSIAFWLKKNGPNPQGGGSSFAFGIATTKSIWTYQDVFLEFEDAGNPSSKDSAACKFYVLDQWFEFTGTKRLPKVLDGEWHQLVFSYDQTTATLTTYVDGAAYTNLPADFGKFTNNGGVVDFSKIAGVVVGGPGNYALGKSSNDIGQGWMGNFNGAIDQFRLYGEAISAADVAALYASKL